MLILAKNNDFYDYVSYQYGVDNKVKFIRESNEVLSNSNAYKLNHYKKFKEMKLPQYIQNIISQTNLTPKIKTNQSLVYLFNGKVDEKNFNYFKDFKRLLHQLSLSSASVKGTSIQDINIFGYFCLVDTLYILMQYSEGGVSKIRFLTNSLLDHLCQKVGFEKDSYTYNFLESYTNPSFEMLSQDLGQPIYVIKYNHGWGFNSVYDVITELPSMQSMGYNALSPDEVYIKIYNFLSNNQRDPDPEPVTDNLKVQMKGFDEKASFRHRKGG